MVHLRSRRVSAALAGLLTVVATTGMTSTGPALADVRVTAVPTTAVIVNGRAASTVSPLPLGRAGLAERRSTVALAPGVLRTSIIRGRMPGNGFPSVSTGPWVVNVVTIDPTRARGTLLVTTGVGLAASERTSEMARRVKALVAMSGGFFEFAAQPSAPGDPTGAVVLGGEIVSSRSTNSGEVHALIEAGSTVRFGTFTPWATVTTASGRVVAIDRIQSPPKSAAIARFTTRWGPRTPIGAGVELVYDAAGCPVFVQTHRGTALKTGQWSLQAEGATAAGVVRSLAKSGCVRYASGLRDEAGRAVPLRRSTYLLDGRGALLRDGANVAASAPRALDFPYARTVLATTASGKVLLITIDGWPSDSAGADLDQAAKVAKVLGARNAINLDGGGSTTMVVRGLVVNRPGLSSERMIGSALAFVPR